MKVIIPKFFVTRRYAKIVEWGKLISIMGSTQIIIQATSLISGILIIRLLSTQEYALYTLANTLLGTMILLADGGISTGAMAKGGQVWKDRDKLGTVLTSGFELRNKFAIGSLIISTPILFYLLNHHGSNWQTSLIILCAIIPAFYAGISGGLLVIAPKLQQDIWPLQKNQLEVNAVRLILICLTIFAFPLAFVVILSSGLPQIWGNFRLQNIAKKYANWKQRPDPLIQKEILFTVKKILPGSIYYCLSGQISIWLISFFGSTSSIAQIGALSRLAILLNLFSILFNTLLVPRFSRLTPVSTVLLRFYLKMFLGLLVLSCFIIGITFLFPVQILWVLGKDYGALKNEVILIMISSCLNLIFGAAFMLYSSRGWIMNPYISIALSVITVSLGIILFDISTLSGVLVLNIFVASVDLIKHFSYGIVRILKIKSIVYSP